ncbi:MAG TPA: hypothetical protein VGF95_05090 [Solirubrobacteraceae bacterium]|jgi:DNA-binding HxlR family transcriptional regulator
MPFPPVVGDPTSGEGFFAVLGDSGQLTLLRELGAAGPLARSELGSRLYVSERTFARQLNSLMRTGLVLSRPMVEDHRRLECELTQAGSELLQVARYTDAVALLAPSVQFWSSRPITEIVADWRNRLVLRALLAGTQSFGSLLHLEPALTHGALARHLKVLVDCGLVRVVKPAGGGPLYELGETTRLLGRALLLSARWHLRWAPERLPRASGDLSGLIHLVAALTRVRLGVHGICRLGVQGQPTMSNWPDVHVFVDAGSSRPLVLSPMRQPDACAEARPLTWCEALLTGELSGIEIEGSEDLMEALLLALARALEPVA